MRVPTVRQMNKCCCEVTTADAGDDQVIDVNYTTLDGNKPVIGCGRWTVVSGGGTFSNRKKYNTVVTNLSDGDNVFKWRISLDCKDCPCAEYSEDTVTITYSLVSSSPSSSISSSVSSSVSSSISSSISSSVSASLSPSSSISSSRSSSLSSSVSSSASSSPSPEGAWFNSDCSWDYRVKITIDNTKVDADLTNFPVYVDLNDLPAGFHTNVNQTDARDIRVTTADEVTEVAREVVFYDSTTNTGELHFIAPAVSNASDTEFYIYYGNAAATEPAAGAANGKNNVWTNGYAAVYHFQEAVNNAVDGYTDSTANTNHGQGVSMGTAAPAGKLAGNGVEFDGTDYISVPDDATLDITADIALEAWVFCDSTVNHGIVAKGDLDGTASAYSLVVFTNVWYSGIDGNYVSGGSTDTIAWHYMVGYREGTAFKLRVDGAEVGSVVYATAISSINEPLIIGGYDALIALFNGKQDELRISNDGRTAAWYDATYDNQNDASTFYSVGAEEPCGG